MNCTFCQTKMHEIRMRGVHVDHCPGCQAVFFDAQELTTYSRHPELETELRDAAERAPHRPSSRRCPRCQASSQIVTTPAAELDHCPLCGGFSLGLAALSAAATAALIAAPLLQQEVERDTANFIGDVGGDAVEVVADIALNAAIRPRGWHIGDGLSGLSDFHAEGSGATAEIATDGAAGLAEGLGEGIGEAGGALSEGIGEAGGALAEGIGEAGGALAEGIGEAGGALLEVAAEGGGAALEIAAGGAEVIGEVAGGFFGFFFELIGELLS